MTQPIAAPTGSPPLTYFPAYVGLFASLVLAATCNAFLDIHYGTFGFEVLLWSVVFGLTLRVGWRQRGEIGASGKHGQKMMLILGIILSLIIFIPMWGFPRAGLAMLAMLQAAQNCVTVTRRQLHLGLLVSAVMVMFAASHYRADWTMLFYLVPYVTAVVFTLVAEQINRRAEGIKEQSLSQVVVGGQGAAIAAATTAILLLGLFLYVVTPQLTWPYLQWRYGQLTNLGWVGQGEEIEVSNQPGNQGPGHGGNSAQTNGKGNTGEGSEGQTGDTQGSGKGGQGQSEGSQDQGQAGTGKEKGGMGGSLGGSGGDSHGYELMPGRGWPSPAEMREAAKRQGMPEWQKDMINKMADAEEWGGKTMQPVMQGLKELLQSFKDWLDQNRNNILLALALLAIMALLYALWRLMKEAKTHIWLLTRLDYMRLGFLGLHHPGVAGGHQFYRAMERLYALHDVERASTSNTREYLSQIYAERGHLYRETAELTRLFEDTRYGMASDRAQISRMRDLYRQLYLRI